MRITKYVGLIAMIPLFTIALTIGFIDDAEARQVHNCGVNEQCNGPAPVFEAKAVENQPHLIVDDVISPIGFQSNEYMAVIKVYAGDSDVTNLQLLVKSDMSAITQRVTETGPRNSGFIAANSHATVPIIIKAADPDTIRAELLSLQSGTEAKAVEKSPYLVFKGKKVLADSAGMPNEYFVTFSVFAGDKDVRNLQLLVQSDVDAEKIRVHSGDKGSGGSSDSGTIWANTYSTETVKIYALNPGSIDGKILSWELLD